MIYLVFLYPQPLGHYDLKLPKRITQEEEDLLGLTLSEASVPCVRADCEIQDTEKFLRQVMLGSF